MHWPKGKYNGRKIDGFSIAIHLHMLDWYWKPITRRNFGEPYFIWLCVTIRAKPSYE